jgi:hypothetical protein
MKNLACFFILLVFGQKLIAQGYRTNNKSKTSNNASARTKSNHDLGKNILTFSPVQILLTDVDQEEPDLAVAFAYERILDNELIGLKLPVSFSLVNNYFYIMPTLKLYPKRQGTVKYAVGPQLLIGAGDASYREYIYNQQTGITIYKSTDITRKQFGFLLNNSVNFTLVKSLYMGIDASLGIIYYDNLPNDINNSFGFYPTYNNNSNINPAFQLNFSMGYRF